MVGTISQSRPIYKVENLGAEPSRNRGKVPKSENKMKAFPENTSKVRGVLLGSGQNYGMLIGQ